MNSKKYVFWFDERCSTLWLDEYLLQNRQTKRHGWKTVEKYERLRERESSIKKEEVPLDEKIKEDAINKLVSVVKVDYWKGR